MSKKTRTFRFDEGSEEDKWADSQDNFNYSMKLLVKLAIKAYGVRDLGYALIESEGGSLRDNSSSKRESSRDNIMDIKDIASEFEQDTSDTETVAKEEVVDTPEPEVGKQTDKSKPTLDQINNFFGS